MFAIKNLWAAWMDISKEQYGSKHSNKNKEVRINEKFSLEMKEIIEII